MGLKGSFRNISRNGSDRDYSEGCSKDHLWILEGRGDIKLKIKECWHALFLIRQKPDFSLKKATKVKDHEASKSQRSKKISLRKFFLFDFWSNWTILSHLAKVFLASRDLPRQQKRIFGCNCNKCINKNTQPLNLNFKMIFLKSYNCIY